MREPVPWFAWAILAAACAVTVAAWVYIWVK
jgi:hypothetical protein